MLLMLFSSMYQKRLILFHILLYCTKFLIHLVRKLHAWLKSFGVVGKLRAWLKSFLTGRTQSVKINYKIHSNLSSQFSSVTSGVIQESVLGLLLYAAYTSDIVRCFSCDHPILYADDLKVIFLIDSSDFPQYFSLIMNDLNALFAWSEFNGLRFNFAECAVLHFGAKILTLCVM